MVHINFTTLQFLGFMKKRKGRILAGFVGLPEVRLKKSSVVGVLTNSLSAFLLRFSFEHILVTIQPVKNWSKIEEKDSYI